MPYNMGKRNCSQDHRNEEIDLDTYGVIDSISHTLPPSYRRLL